MSWRGWVSLESCWLGLWQGSLDAAPCTIAVLGSTRWNSCRKQQGRGRNYGKLWLGTSLPHPFAIGYCTQDLMCGGRGHGAWYAMWLLGCSDRFICSIWGCCCGSRYVAVLDAIQCSHWLCNDMLRGPSLYGYTLPSQYVITSTLSVCLPTWFTSAAVSIHITYSCSLLLAVPFQVVFHFLCQCIYQTNWFTKLWVWWFLQTWFHMSTIWFIITRHTAYGLRHAAC
jgi:hypothetical protein